uniref:S-protein homolog n=1 Tax=Solanum lycopersicum TaxID=4081 RepID=A0A3Q7I985_SOLLC
MGRCVILFIMLGLACYLMTLISIIQPDDYFEKIYNIHIINGFTNNSSVPLVVWCISSDNVDLGGRALQERDEFSWSVKSTFWKNTKFLCTMKFDNQRRSFQAFQRRRDIQRCYPTRECFWLVKEDGFYYSNDEIYWRKDFNWTLN